MSGLIFIIIRLVWKISYWIWICIQYQSGILVIDHNLGGLVQIHRNRGSSPEDFLPVMILQLTCIKELSWELELGIPLVPEGKIR